MGHNQGGGAGQESGSQTGGNQGQAPGAQQGQGQAPEAQQQGNQQGQQGGQGGSGDQFDPSTIQDPAIRAYLEGVQRSAEEARQQAARYRTERNTVQTQFQQFQQQHETDEQRAQRERQERDQQAQQERERVETLERENRNLRIAGTVLTAATSARAHNPATVQAMIQDKVTLDEKGQPTNLDALLTGLRESDPYLFKRAAADAGSGSGEGSSAPTDMNDLIRGAWHARQGRAVETN